MGEAAYRLFSPRGNRDKKLPMVGTCGKVADVCMYVGGEAQKAASRLLRENAETVINMYIHREQAQAFTYFHLSQRFLALLGPKKIFSFLFLFSQQYSFASSSTIFYEHVHIEQRGAPLSFLFIQLYTCIVLYIQ